jgi:steroid 5-alpha reductase family enzyme
MERYEAISEFRRLMGQMDWFWGVGGFVVAAVTTVVVFGVEDENMSFRVGLAVLTVWWAERALRREKELACVCY